MSLVDDDPGPQYRVKRQQRDISGNYGMYTTARKRVRVAAKRDFKKKAAVGRALVQSAVFQKRVASRRLASIGELKGMDTTMTHATVLATTSDNSDIDVLNLIVPGNGSWNRIGRKINPKTIRITGLATHTYALTTTTNDVRGNVLRMIVVWDANPNGGATVAGGGAALPSFDTIFGGTSQAGTESTTMMDTLKYDAMDRFKILRDVKFQSMVWATPPLAGTQNEVENTHVIDEFIQLPECETLYGGQSDPQTIADIQSGGLYVIWRCAANSATNYWSTNSTKARLRYADK